MGLSPRRRRLAPACADATRQRRRAEVNAMSPIGEPSVPFPADRQRLIDGVLAGWEIVG